MGKGATSLVDRPGLSLGDTIQVEGLGAVLEDEEELPSVELWLGSHGRRFHATILAADGEWTVNVRDERGKSCPGSGELYPTQAEAILASMLITLDRARRIPWTEPGAESQA